MNYGEEAWFNKQDIANVGGVQRDRGQDCADLVNKCLDLQAADPALADAYTVSWDASHEVL